MDLIKNKREIFPASEEIKSKTTKSTANFWVPGEDFCMDSLLVEPFHRDIQSEWINFIIRHTDIGHMHICYCIQSFDNFPENVQTERVMCSDSISSHFAKQSCTHANDAHYCGTIENQTISFAAERVPSIEIRVEHTFATKNKNTLMSQPSVFHKMWTCLWRRFDPALISNKSGQRTCVRL